MRFYEISAQARFLIRSYIARSKTTCRTAPPADHRFNSSSGSSGATTTGLQLDERLIGPAPQHYELIEEIGRGGAGVVYLARQAGLDRPVAVKMLLSGRRSGRSQLARFRRESAALARLTHPNVVQVYDCGELDGAPFLAMEYIDGPSLAERLRRGPLEVTQAARWIKALADAVAFAHESGIYIAT